MDCIEEDVESQDVEHVIDDRDSLDIFSEDVRDFIMECIQ